MADCKAEPAPGSEYDVFLNFRGEDTRHNFTDFLYNRLKDAGVHTFRDEEGIPHGDVISERLENAINNSKLYIPIFSLDYASSKWCLRELKLIVDNENASRDTKSILPIFFHVKPEDVKLKTSLYSKALLEHPEKFRDEAKGWTEALEKVGKIKGLNVEKDKGQAKIVELVVEEVLAKLKIKDKLVTEHLIGLGGRVKDLTKLLDVKQDDVRLVGIYGMGGIGKTTVAEFIFHQLSSHFGRYRSFLKGIRERSTEDGVVQLQNKLLCNISGSIRQVEDSNQGKRMIEKILSNKMVLIVLDDVNEKDPIKNLMGNISFNSGSRIIITTRNKATLDVEGFRGEILRYEMPTMDDGHALELFNRHALGGEFSSDDYWLSREIVSHAGGLPQAIKVIGSLLKGKDKEFWKGTLDRLTKATEKEILENLRISYVDLDEDAQQIFLDIACFFFNEKRTDAIYVWTDLFPTRGIEFLIDRCLIKIVDNDKFWIHDQLMDLGWQIVHEKSTSDLGKQSRLGITKENLEIITIEERNEEVRALQIDGSDDYIEITSEELKRLQNLRFLKLRNATFVGDFRKCRLKLRWISWKPPLREFRATNMYLNDLVVFKLGKNNFTDNSKAWHLIKMAKNLKVLSLADCDGITTNPNFSECSGLKRLSLQRCNGLKRIERFVGDLQSLIMLEIEWCPCLTNLPEKVGELVNLEHLSLRGCPELKELPVSLGSLTSLKHLDLSGTGIAELPITINMLHHLQTLNLLGCHGIQQLPELPTSLTCLHLESNSLRLFPDLSNLTNLVELGLSDVSSFTNKSNCNSRCNLSWIGRLSRLKKLELYLLNVSAPPELASLSQLEELTLGDLDLRTLEQLPSSLLSLELQFCIIEWTELTNLLVGYSKGEDVPLDRLPQLENLTVYGCKLLQRLSIPPELRKLRQVSVSSCPRLVDIHIAGPSKSLESFFIRKCESLRRVDGLSYLKNLERLEIGLCNVLTNVEDLNELETLMSLKVIACKSLGSLIHASRAIIPDDCLLHILGCGHPSTYPCGMSLKCYRKEILLKTSYFEFTSDKMERPFTIDFILKKQFGGDFSVRWREKKDVRPDSVTYKGLIADVQGFGFRSERISYKNPGEDGEVEIKSDEQVKGMVQLASERGFIVLTIEGAVDISLDGAITWARQWGCTINFLVFFFCVAFFLFLSFLLGRLDFPKKIEQLAGMRRFNLREDLVVILVFHCLCLGLGKLGSVSL